MISRIKAYLLHHFREIVKFKTSPHSIALGFAIGTFIAVLPSPGINILLAFLALLVFENINKFALFAAIAIWNPVTVLPISYFSYNLGKSIFGTDPVDVFSSPWLNSALYFLRNYFLGNLIIALILSFASYFIVKFFVVRYRKEHEED